MAAEMDISSTHAAGQWPALTDLLPLLRCPRCHGSLALLTDHLHCQSAHCRHRYPLVGGIPVLLNEERSLFTATDVQPLAGPTRSLSDLGHTVLAWLPGLNRNVQAAGNFRLFAEQLLQLTPNPTVLVVGGAILGQGMAALLEYPALRLIETDVYIGERTRLVCDAHDLPFDDGSVDGVVAQAVLEHTLDPARCVAEMHRVLQPRGLVYAETPFMQQVHMGRYDFTRFTHLGHRRLFRHFEEIVSGAGCGPGMALAWSYEHFLLSFVSRPALRLLVRGFARLTAGWLTAFDPWLTRTPGGLDAASGLFFLGRKSERVLSDRDLIARYRGALR